MLADHPRAAAGSVLVPPSPTSTGRRGRAALTLSVVVAAAASASLVAPAINASAQADPRTAVTASAPGGPIVTSPMAVSTADRLSAVSQAARASRSAQRGPLPSGEPDPEVVGGEATKLLPDAPVLPEVVGTRYSTTDLNVRTRPSLDSKVVTTVDYGDTLKVTAVRDGEWRLVALKGERYWVKSTFLSKSKPAPRPAGPSMAACASGSGVESGLASTTIAVHRAVCNAFPSVSTYGGLRGGGGNHGSGHALDIMVSGGTGDAIAAYVRAHAGELGVSEVIWSQHIWTVQRAGEGWRWMSNRGSATANHYDHVHVSTY